MINKDLFSFESFADNGVGLSFARCVFILFFYFCHICQSLLKE